MPPTPDEQDTLHAIRDAVTDPPDTLTSAEGLARFFHETYERLAPEFGYETREVSRTDWANVPEQNKALMIAVAGEILAPLRRELADANKRADEAQLRSIEARNPGIDMGEVRAALAAHDQQSGDEWEMRVTLEEARSPDVSDTPEPAHRPCDRCKGEGGGMEDTLGGPVYSSCHECDGEGYVLAVPEGGQPESPWDLAQRANPPALGGQPDTDDTCRACQGRGWVWEGNASIGEGTPADCPECARHEREHFLSQPNTDDELLARADDWDRMPVWPGELITDLASALRRKRDELGDALRKAQRPGSVLAEQRGKPGTWYWLWSDNGGIGHEEASPAETAALRTADRNEGNRR